jgi:hypothetical protein
MTKISMSIIAIILSTSDDITKNSGINNGGWIPFLHVTALGSGIRYYNSTEQQIQGDSNSSQIC